MKETPKPLGNIQPPKPVRPTSKIQRPLWLVFYSIFSGRNLQYSQKYLTQVLQNKLQTDVPVKNVTFSLLNTISI